MAFHPDLDKRSPFDDDADTPILVPVNGLLAVVDDDEEDGDEGDDLTDERDENPRERGDDDGVEYADPRDEMDDRLWRDDLTVT